MKQQRFRFKLLALLMFALFALLAAFGVYSVGVSGNRWFTSAQNSRIQAQKANVTAGSIYDRNGVLLASTVDGQRVYQADEAARRAVVHVLGNADGNVYKGVESFQAVHLYGFNATFTEVLSALLSGQPRRGDDVTLTLDSRLCTAITQYYAANSATRNKKGAAVVMNYKTGEVIAIVSLPSFDPMVSGSRGTDLTTNRATRSLYPPGSTFKIITTAAALQYISGVTTTEIACTGGLLVDGQAIRDFGNTVHTRLTLRQAFVKSCNNIYALLALDMGDAALRKTAEAFGFNDNFLFRDLVVENSVYPTGSRSQFEIAMSGFGQSSIGVTPLHMCLVAAAVANDGVMMEPVLLQQVTSPGGALREKLQSRVYREVLTPEIITVLQDYMRAVVTGGTGTRAAVSGMTICGKTGSAETSLNGRYVTHGWFVGYCADDAYPYALAVVVEDIGDGAGGGSTAAPIAGEIFRYLKEQTPYAN